MSVLDDENVTFNVVVNSEEQHALWPVDLDLPAGWRATGKQGNKAACAEYIYHAWPDIRPLSVRRGLSSPGRSDGTNPSQAPRSGGAATAGR